MAPGTARDASDNGNIYNAHYDAPYIATLDTGEISAIKATSLIFFLPLAGVFSLTPNATNGNKRYLLDGIAGI